MSGGAHCPQGCLPSGLGLEGEASDALGVAAGRYISSRLADEALQWATPGGGKGLKSSGQYSAADMLCKGPSAGVAGGDGTLAPLDFILGGWNEESIVRSGVRISLPTGGELGKFFPGGVYHK